MKSLLYLLLVTSFLSCGGKTVTSLHKESPNGKVKIHIEANRTTAIESWKVVMRVKAYNFKEGSLKFEIFAKDLTDENVSFIWQDDHNCEIIFKQQDDSERKFHLIASQEQLQMGEM
jgi:hypothetical protein